MITETVTVDFETYDRVPAYKPATHIGRPQAHVTEARIVIAWLADLDKSDRDAVVSSAEAVAESFYETDPTVADVESGLMPLTSRRGESEREMWGSDDYPQDF